MQILLTKMNNTVEREKAKRGASNNGQTVTGYIPRTGEHLKINFNFFLPPLSSLMLGFEMSHPTSGCEVRGDPSPRVARRRELPTEQVSQF